MARARIAFVVMSCFVALAGCGGTSGKPGGGSGGSGGSGGGSGSGGTPGWHVSYPNQGAFVAETGFGGNPTSGMPAITGTPDPMDPWWNDWTDRTFDWTSTDGPASAEAHLTFAKSDNVITISGSAAAKGGQVHAIARAALAGVWCYTPSAPATSVTFTIDGSQSTMPTATGVYGGGAWSFQNWNMDCTSSFAVGPGGAGGVTTCTSTTVTAQIHNGKACLPLGGTSASVEWTVDGGNGNPNTDGSGSVTAKFVITATPQ